MIVMINFGQNLDHYWHIKPGVHVIFDQSHRAVSVIDFEGSEHCPHVQIIEIGEQFLDVGASGGYTVKYVELIDAGTVIRTTEYWGRS